MAGEYQKLSQLQKRQLDGEMPNKQLEAQLIGIVQHNLSKMDKLKGMMILNQEDLKNVLIVGRKGICLESVRNQEKKDLQGKVVGNESQ